MSEGLEYPFTAEQIGNQARVNAGGLLLAVTAYAKEQGLSAEGMWRSMGAKFAPGWEGLRGAPVIEVARWFALNMVAFGSKLQSLTGDEKEAQIVTAGWPGPEWLEQFDLSLGEAFSVQASWSPIAEYLGLVHAWSRDGDEITQTLHRPE